MAFGLSPGATTGIGLFLVVGFCIWKFIIQPIESEGKPIEPSKEDLEEAPLGF